MRLRFWFSRGGQVLLSILGASFLYGLLMGLQTNQASLAAVLDLLPVYLTVFGAVMLMANMLAAYKFLLDLSLSLGSTRREAFAGLQIYRLFPILVIALVLALLSLIPGTEPFWGPALLFPAALGLFLLAGAVGSVFGMVYLRFGKVATVLTVILLVLTGGVCGALTVLFTKASWPVQADWIPWLILAAGAAVYGLVLIPESRVVRRYQVRI